MTRASRATLILLAFVLGACERQADRPAAWPLFQVTIADVPGPVAASVKVAPGSNLRAIASTAYRHERFSGFVARLNGLPNPEQVASGATLQTPSLPAAFRDAGLDPRYQPAINVLAKAWLDYTTALPAYKKAREASGISAGKFVIPTDARLAFLHSAGATEAACRVLAAAASPHRPPEMAIGQFSEAARQLRELASGSIDGYGYDMDLVGQRFGLGFTNALIWTQQQHR